MSEAVRRCLVLLVAIAIIGGQSFQLARASEAGIVVAGMPCSMSMPAHAADGHSKPVAPCKTMTGDCMKQMGCVADVALPARFAAACCTLHYTHVAYWSAGTGLGGLVREPDPFPPRTI